MNSTRRPLGARRVAVLAALAATMLTGVATVATAAMPQPRVVSQNAQAGTPEVVASSVITQPAVNAFAAIGPTMYAGGDFDTIGQGGSTYSRSYLVAFNAASGAVSSSFAPGLDGKVWALAADPATNSIYVGGAFTTVNGTARPALVKLDATTGAVDPAFSPTFTGGQLNALQLVTLNGVRHLFIGGTPGKKLMSLNPATGRDDKYFQSVITNAIPGAWGGVAVYQFAIDPSQTHLVATGNFMTVDGQSRTRFFMLDLGATGAVLDPWYYPGFAKPCTSTAARRIAYLQGVDWSPDGAFFDITATGQIPKNKSDVWYQRLGSANVPNTTVCDAVGRFALSDPTKPVWINYTGGDSVWHAADTGVAVYVLGHFRWMDNPDGYGSIGVGDKTSGAPAAFRAGVAAIDPVTGLAESWNPGLTATKQGGKGFLVTPDGLWIGNDATAFNGAPHYGMEFAPLPAAPPPDQVVWAVGDACQAAAGSACGGVGTLIASDPDKDAVLGLGNLQYPQGSASDYATYYDPQMGSGAGLKTLTYPTPGNLDYLTNNASGYFSYWGTQAGDPAMGYYAVDLGGWRVIAANSACNKVGGCGGSSPEGQYLRQQLIDAGSKCELVFDHYPAYSDGVLGDQSYGKSIFSVAVNNGADLMLSANDQSYQRFPALDASGNPSPNGLTELVVGTGGAGLGAWQNTPQRSTYRQNSSYGAVRLVLSATGWTADYYSTGGTVMDSASGTCH